MAKKKKSTGIVDQPYSPEKYEIEEDLRALGRAHAVRKDPERMKKAKTLAKEKLDENQKKKEEAEHLIDLGQGEKEEGEKEKE